MACRAVLTLSLKKLLTTGAQGPKLSAQRSPPLRVNRPYQHLRLGVSSIENWHVPEIAVAPFPIQKSRGFLYSCSGRTGRGSSST